MDDFDWLEDYYHQILRESPAIRSEIGSHIARVIGHWESKIDPLYGPDARSEI